MPNNGKPDHRTKDREKSRSRERIRVICERVMEIRGVEVETLFLTRRRDNRQAASARSLAMAACCATGIPLCHVARAFGRSWSTVHGAEMIASKRGAGALQSEMATDLGITAGSFFYVVKVLHLQQCPTVLWRACNC